MNADSGVDRPESDVALSGAPTKPKMVAGRFLEDVLSSHAGENVWEALSQSHGPAPFVPDWETSAAPPAEESPSAESQEQPQEQPGEQEQLQAQLQEQVEALLREAEQEAQQQAEALLQEAEREVQRLKEEAYAAGFAAGDQRGFEAGQQRVEPLLHSLGQALREVGRLRAQIFEQSEHQLLELALAIARKVLHHEGSVNRNAILPLVRAGIKKATQRQELRIKVHPADMLFTASCKAQLLSFLDGIETITFEETDTVPPGTCVVETPAEIVDLRWDEQLEEVAASLFRAYDRGREEGNG